MPGMTRRITLAIVATVLATLLVVGGTTLTIARSQARATTERDLRVQAETLLGAVAASAPNQAGSPEVQRALAEMRRALRLDGVEVITLGPSGGLTGRLPDGVAQDDLDMGSLRDGHPISGHHGSLAYAAAAQTIRRTTVVVVVTAPTSTRVGRAARWFVLAALFTLAAGAVVGVVIGRRLARPVRRVSDAARSIAAGGLSVRLPVPAASRTDELAELDRAINAMAAGLERSRTLDQQFLLSISHDLRTPLTSIRGHAEAIVDGVSERPAESAAVIEREAQRLDRLVADLLDLARLDAHAFTLVPSSFELGTLLRDVIEEFSVTAAHHGITVTFDDAERPLVVRADGNRVRQVLHNLLDNAAKYADRRVALTARLDVGPEGRAVITVDDDGPGIATEDQPHVFERLYVARARPVRAETGSGLGLAIARQLVEAMGGSITAGRAPDGGARFEFTLPVHTDGPAT